MLDEEANLSRGKVGACSLKSFAKGETHEFIYNGVRASDGYKALPIC